MRCDYHDSYVFKIHAEAAVVSAGALHDGSDIQLFCGGWGQLVRLPLEGERKGGGDRGPGC